MCYSNCPYEGYDGECRGMKGVSKGVPHCYTPEEWKSYNESVEEDKVLDYELTRQEGIDN